MPWSEHQKLQFRWEAFNVFNHTNFAVPGDPTSLTNSNNISPTQCVWRDQRDRWQPAAIAGFPAV